MCVDDGAGSICLCPWQRATPKPPGRLRRSSCGYRLWQCWWVWASPRRATPGTGVVENKHSTHAESPPPPPPFASFASFASSSHSSSFSSSSSSCSSSSCHVTPLPPTERVCVSIHPVGKSCSEISSTAFSQ